jgi:hypothetical protein
VKRRYGQNLENQQVKGALNEIGWLAHRYPRLPRSYCNLDRRARSVVKTYR